MGRANEKHKGVCAMETVNNEITYFGGRALLPASFIIILTLLEKSNIIEMLLIVI